MNAILLSVILNAGPAEDWPVAPKEVAMAFLKENASMDFLKEPPPPPPSASTLGTIVSTLTYSHPVSSYSMPMSYQAPPVMYSAPPPVQYYQPMYQAPPVMYSQTVRYTQPIMRFAATRTRSGTCATGY